MGLGCNRVRTRGRLFREEEDPIRSRYRRDADRVIHSAAFRRLEYKTQVFVNHEGDHYRTRLTHSLEVAQIARSFCRGMGLDEDLGETLALAHDLGHPPFGHAGEAALDEMNRSFHGFDHNAQTLKILTQLEQRYAEFDGLNLTWETLEGVVKHNGPVVGAAVTPYIAQFNEVFDLELSSYASLEAQFAAISDDIAYNNHDIDDGVRAGLFSLSDLHDVPLVGGILDELCVRYSGLEDNRLTHEVIRRMIHRMVHDVIQVVDANVHDSGVETVDDVRGLDRSLVHFSEGMEMQHRALKQFLMERMYRHSRVQAMTQEAHERVKGLFQYYMETPDAMPEEWYVKAKEAQDAIRAEVVTDFIAGMTDRYAIQRSESKGRAEMETS